MEQVDNVTATVHDPVYFRKYLEKAGCTFSGVPHPIKISSFDPEKTERIFGTNTETVRKSIIPVLINYLQKVVITDSFDDPDQRRLWRVSLPLDIRKYYEDNNKIRSNNVTLALGMISLLPEFTEDEEVGQRIQDEFDKLGTESKDSAKKFIYDELSLEGKKEFLEKLDKATLKVLEIIR